MTLSPLTEPRRALHSGSDRHAPWFVSPIPACAPPAASWSSAPERDVDAGAGHPLLPLVLPVSDPDDIDETDGIEGLLAVPTPPGAENRSGSSAGPGLPDATAWSTWMARMMIEVTHGRRPVGQLARWADERVLATVVLRTRQLKLAGRPARAEARSPRRAQPAGLGSVRVQRPTPGAVEAMATVRSHRPAAFAFRLEARGERWLCTAVDFGPQTPQPA